MKEIKFYSEPLEMEYTRSPGKLLGEFFVKLRDEGVVAGVRCSNCSYVFVPPQQFCPECSSKMINFVNMPSVGTVASFTVVRKDSPFAQWKAPFAFVAVKYDGANSLFWHRLKDIEGIKVGDKVQPVFKKEEDRQGSILDIEYFEKV
ncbi:MAG: Zn-ribbon domain-containing OB-fold protein [Leptospiraceae bacterium]|nr:Zn-ribbon domain-containing OB-fold protein [Leptospiraceae bacterium]